jgi:hypothetical protein
LRPGSGPAGTVNRDVPTTRPQGYRYGSQLLLGAPKGERTDNEQYSDLRSISLGHAGPCVIPILAGLNGYREGRVVAVLIEIS